MNKDNDINKTLIEKINNLEEKYEGNFSNTQKILLTTDGSITAILDVLHGKISLKTINQYFTEADKEISDLLNIQIGDTVIFREILMYKDKQPLIYAISYFPVKRLSEEFKSDLQKKDIPLGRILRKYSIESRREVKNINIENPTERLENIYKTNEEFLARDYNIIKSNEIFIWVKELFPISYFK